MRQLGILLLATLLVVASGQQVRADDSPWSQGVSAELRDQAGALFVKGNALMDEAFWKEAAANYRQALKHWDNPAIRGNLAICLLNLDQPIEGYSHMKQALRYGQAPFTPGAYRNLLANRRLLQGQVAELEILSTSDTRLLLDGKVLISNGTGPRPLVLRPGPHRVEGYRPNHLSRNEVINLVPGKQHKVDIQLDSLADATTYSRRWQPWKTWAVAGGAGVLALSSLALMLQARTDQDDYTRAVDTWCEPRGCLPGGAEGETELPASFTDTKDRGDLLQSLGIATGVSSGALVLGTVVLWYLNRPQRNLRSSYEARLPVQISVTPQEGGAGVLGTIAF